MDDRAGKGADIDESVPPVESVDDGVTLFHGTDAASADDILQNGFDLRKAANLGGGDLLWTTTSRADATLFAQANPAGGDPTIVGIRAPNSIINRLLSKGLLIITGTSYIFEPGAIDILNLGAALWKVP